MWLNRLSVYRRLLTIPHVSRFVFGGVIAQFPSSMLSMAVLIGVRDGYDSYLLAGIASAVMALSGAFIGPQVGRAVDRWGQRKIGLVVGTFWIIVQLFLALCLVVVPAFWVILSVCGLLGISVPSNSILRARWVVALKEKPQMMPSALSLTSVLEECMWVIGTPLSTVLATLISPLAPITFSIAAILLGVFVMLLPDRTHEPQITPRYVSRKKLPIANYESDHPVLYTRAFVGLMGVLVFYGAFQSATGVAVVAFANERGVQEFAGLVSASFSLASMISAIFYGSRNWQSPLWRRFFGGLVILATGCSMLIFVNGMWSAALVLFISGIFQAPTTINVNQMLIQLLPSKRFTEGMALAGSMWVVGLSLSNLVAGAMIDHFGSRGGFVSIVGFAVIALVIGALNMSKIRQRLAA